MNIAGIGTVGKEQLILIGKSGEPNWSYIPTKGKSSKTKAEFVSEIKELARQAASTLNKSESEYISKKVLSLRAEYLSDVAPDRKSMYQQAKNAIKKQENDLKCKGYGEITLLDFLEREEWKNSDFAKKHFALAAGGTLNCPILSTGGYGVEINSQGVNVLSNLGHGWGYEMTPAELAKKDEFYSIYWNEYNFVKDNVAVDNNLDEKELFSGNSNELYQENTYSKKTLLGMDNKDILANMLEHMSNAEKSEKIRELKGEINPAEIYSFRINNGKVEISGGDGFAGKAR